MTPRLLVVSGLPAAGKTTLATALAREFPWPLVSKDDYKTLLLDAFPDGDLPGRSRQVGLYSFRVMWQVARVVLRAGQSVILETHFDRVHALPPILELARTHRAQLSQVFCDAPLAELERRHAARVQAAQRPGIDLPGIHSLLPPTANWEPLDLGNVPLLRVDTTQPDAAGRAAAWVRTPGGKLTG